MDKFFKNNMNILMISNDFLPNTGGVANHVFELSKAMVASGHDVTVLHCCYEKTNPVQEIIQGVKIIRVTLTNNSAHKQDKFSKAWRYIATIFNGSRAIRKAIKQLKPDVVHWHDFYHTSMAMFLVGFKGKRVLTNHASGYLEQYECGGIWHTYLKWLAKKAKVIIAPSQELADKSCILNKPVHFIPNGVDADVFKPQKSKQVLADVPENAFLIVAPRRLDPKNGLDYLINAVPIIKQSIPHVYLMIAGGGPESLLNEYQQLIQSLNVSDYVTITGAVPYAKMPSIIANSDLIVVPSLMEAVSLAALEALSSGVPVIASNVGGLPFVIDDTVGALVPPKNPEALAKAVIDFYQSPAKKMDAMKKAARQRILDAFTWRKIASRTVEVYGSADAKNN